LLRRNAYDDRQIRGLEIADGALDRLEAESGMLEIEQHEVATCRLENMPDSRRGELHDEMPELRAPGLSHLLQALRCHALLPCVAFLGRSIATSTRASGEASRSSLAIRARVAARPQALSRTPHLAPARMARRSGPRQNGFQVA